MDEQEILEIAKRNLRNFPLFEEYHQIEVKSIEKDVALIGYRTLPNKPSFGTTHLSLQIEEDICLIVEIGVKEEFRGKGYGSKLYEVAMEIGRDLKCKTCRQSSSGQTYSGETRKDYLIRREWREVNEMEVERAL